MTTADDRRSGAGRVAFTFLRDLSDERLELLAHGSMESYAAPEEAKKP